jgi:hypothetical protein
MRGREAYDRARSGMNTGTTGSTGNTGYGSTTGNIGTGGYGTTGNTDFSTAGSGTTNRGV